MEEDLKQIHLKTKLLSANYCKDLEKIINDALTKNDRKDFQKALQLEMVNDNLISTINRLLDSSDELEEIIKKLYK